ncbi:hypothetical protein H0H92_004089 [Tricholoma furcatifolium]|nr:hypothetical protein H0H92_004089 [Tricholoma furcatifolium]
MQELGITPLNPANVNASVTRVNIEIAEKSQETMTPLQTALAPPQTTTPIHPRILEATVPRPLIERIERASQSPAEVNVSPNESGGQGCTRNQSMKTRGAKQTVDTLSSTIKTSKGPSENFCAHLDFPEGSQPPNGKRFCEASQPALIPSSQLSDISDLLKRIEVVSEITKSSLDTALLLDGSKQHRTGTPPPTPMVKRLRSASPIETKSGGSTRITSRGSSTRTWSPTTRGLDKAIRTRIWGGDFALLSSIHEFSDLERSMLNANGYIYNNPISGSSSTSAPRNRSSVDRSCGGNKRGVCKQWMPLPS